MSGEPPPPIPRGEPRCDDSGELPVNDCAYGCRPYLLGELGDAANRRIEPLDGAVASAVAGAGAGTARADDKDAAAVMCRAALTDEYAVCD